VSLLHKWIHQSEEDGGKSFVGSGHLSHKDQQIRELQMKNKDLQEENDIKKRQTATLRKT
jgi:transposase-like protein